MNNIICKVAALGGIISTTDISHLSEYKRLLRAKERGDLIKLRHGIYAVPDALLNTMIDVERIVPNGIVCLYNAWAYHQLSTTVPPAFCIASFSGAKIEQINEIHYFLVYQLYLFNISINFITFM